MPLFRRKPFPVVEAPKDLKPHELVYQVRFTKEIFCDYHDYLNRMNLYRQRCWTCKITGKSYLTYEEALVSEKRATEKIKQFPKELIAPVLCIIQFSMLPLKDLISTITVKLQECLFEGIELYGRKDNGVCLCKILKVLEEDADKTYEVAWLDKDKKSIGSAVVNGEDLIRKKLPFSRAVLKSFIRESTYRSVPWMLHDKLARKHGISIDPPEELSSKVFFKDGQVVSNKKKRKSEEDRKNIVGAKKEEFSESKRKRLEKEKLGALAMEKNVWKEDDSLMEEPIKYPIDDLLVQPGEDDPTFTECPSPSRDFNVPMDCVGDLLMVWDFCSSYGRLLNLWPFSLEDFENAICHKDSNLFLIVESHSALLRLLIKDDGEYFSVVRDKKRKSKITRINWTEYLCDFLELINIPELCNHITTIKRGHYGLLYTHAKLGIFRELVSHAIATDLFREKLDEYLEERQALGATRREEALEEAKKKREDKEQVKPVSDANDVADRHSVESVGSNLNVAANDNHNGQSIDIADKRNEAVSTQQNHALEKRDSKHGDATLKKPGKKKKMEIKVLAENVKDPSRKEAHKMTLQRQRDDKTEAMEKRSKEQRKEYFEREMEKRLIRTNSLGKDRNYNRYWWFRRDGRLFVESSDSKLWGYFGAKEEVDALMGSLNRKGVRERALLKQLEKCYRKICLELQRRSKDTAHRIAMEEAVLRRSTRVRAPPRDNPANAFLSYVNKWKEDC